MKCPDCNSATHVVSSRNFLRRRECLNPACMNRFSTREVLTVRIGSNAMRVRDARIVSLALSGLLYDDIEKMTGTPAGSVSKIVRKAQAAAGGALALPHRQGRKRGT